MRRGLRLRRQIRGRRPSHQNNTKRVTITHKTEIQLRNTTKDKTRSTSADSLASSIADDGSSPTRPLNKEPPRECQLKRSTIGELHRISQTCMRGKTMENRRYSGHWSHCSPYSGHYDAGFLLRQWGCIPRAPLIDPQFQVPFTKRSFPLRLTSTQRRQSDGKLEKNCSRLTKEYLMLARDGDIGPMLTYPKTNYRFMQIHRVTHLLL